MKVDNDERCWLALRYGFVDLVSEDGNWFRLLNWIREPGGFVAIEDYSSVRKYETSALWALSFLYRSSL